MKRFNIVYLFMSLWVVLAACSDETEPVLHTTSVPVLQNLSQDSYVLEAGNADAAFATFSWSQAAFSQKVAWYNVLQMDKAGNNFASPTALASTTGTEASVTVKEMNTALTRLGFAPEETASMEFRIIINYQGSESYGNASNVVAASIKTYEAGEITYPVIYVPGNHQGWKPELAATLYDLKTDGIYTGYIYLNGEFKFTTEPNWDGTNLGDDGAGGLSNDSGAGNLTAEAGYYFATVNVPGQTYTLEKREWGILGDATPTAWDSDTKLIYDATDMLLKVDITLTTGEFKFRANDGWDVNLGLAEGGTIDEPLAAGGANIPVSAGTYRVILDLRTPEYKAQLTTPGDPLPEPEPEPEPDDYPENLYMIGEFASWDWGSDQIAEMIPVNGKDGHFWRIAYFAANSPFKWAPGKEWANDFAKQDEVIGYQVVDGNAVVDKDGLYMIYIDLENKKIAIEEAKIYGMGDCFGSWDGETYPFALEGAKASYTATGTGELRIYAGSSIAVSDWWTREFVILEGKIAYRGKGGDQERVTVEAGKTVTLDFSDGTGTIE